MRIFATLLLFLAGCATTADDLTRDAAKSVVRPVLQEQFPGIPVEPATDCIIDNASAEELLALAADAVTGPTASTVQVIGNIASRPETITCLASDGLPAILGSL